MPIVRVNGVSNPIQFPDEMSREQMLAVLRDKFSTNLFDAASPISLPNRQQTIEPVNKSLAQRAGQGISDFLSDTGIISNPSRAFETGQTLSALGELLPGIGDVAAGDEFGKALAEGDALGVGIGALSAVPILGGVASKAIKKLTRIAQFEKVKYDRLFDPLKAEFKLASPQRKEELKESARLLRKPLDMANSNLIAEESKEALQSRVRNKINSTKLNNEIKIATTEDASGTFGTGAKMVTYKHEPSGGFIKILKKPNGDSSVVDLFVDEKQRGVGIGKALQSRAIKDSNKLTGQIHSKAAAKTAFDLGRRPVGNPNATIEDVFKKIDENSSVNLVIDNTPKKDKTFSGKVFHQTDKSFGDFDFNKTADGTVWFTTDKKNFSDPASSASAASGKGRIIEKEIKLNKVAGFEELDKFSVAELQQQGFDGAVLDGDIQVFDPKAIN